LVAGETTALDALPALHDRLVELAGPAGFEVVEP
jgi:hypothetical protein